MKVSEFEAKLATVSDARLLQMLSASREQGPEVAVKMILAEGRRRGLENLESPAGMEDMDSMGAVETAENPEDASGIMPAAVATTAYAPEAAGAHGSDSPEAAPAAGSGVETGVEAAVPFEEPSPEGKDWLTEESKKGMPMKAKVALAGVVLAALLAVAWKFAH